MKRYYVIFTGRVQGVGFRWTLLNIVNHYGYTGWVRNMYNGNVEAEIQGRDISIPELVRAIEKNSHWIRIDDYSCREIPLEEHEYNFDVDY